jgi:hypothetical protein
MRKCAFFAMLLTAAWAADRPDLSGKWVLDITQSPGAARLKSETLSIDQKPDSVQISQDATETNGKVMKVDFSCNTEGQQCKIKENGQPAQLSMWYNGPVLVMMEQRHNNDYVTKTRLKPSDDGKTLTMQVEYIAPMGRKPENFVFTRQ